MKQLCVLTEEISQQMVDVKTFYNIWWAVKCSENVLKCFLLDEPLAGMDLFLQGNYIITTDDQKFP